MRQSGLSANSRRGSIAALIAVSMVPLVGLIGLAVDYARVALVRSELQKAVDAASIAAARYLESNNTLADAEIVADGRAYFEANLWLGQNFGFKLDTSMPKVEIVGSERMQTSVTASGKVALSFASMLGVESSTISATSRTQRFVRGLEVVLALDTSSSMRANNRMKNLREAAVDLVQIIYGTQHDIISRRYDCELKLDAQGKRYRECKAIGFGLQVGVVPFSAAVNVSPRAIDSGIVDDSMFNTNEIVQTAQTAARRYASDPAYGRRLTRNPLENEVNPPSTIANWWKGCVTARPYPLEAAEATTLPSVTPFKPYFWDSSSQETFDSSPEHKARGFDRVAASNFWHKETRWKFNIVEKKDKEGNPERDKSGNKIMRSELEYLNYARVEAWTYSLLDGSGGASSENYDRVTKTNTALIGANNGNAASGPNKGCTSPLMPLQPSRTAALNAILPLAPDAGNGTAITLGLAWAWRLLDPSWESIWRKHRSYHWDLSEGDRFGLQGDTRRVEAANYATTVVGDSHLLVDGAEIATKQVWMSTQPWRYIQEYKNPHTEKAVILFTDGQNEIGNGGDGKEGSSKESCCYSAYGTWWHDVKKDRSLQPEPQAALNDQTKALCQAMKDKGIRIFIVQLHNNPPPALKKIFTGEQDSCATDVNHYFQVTDANLKALRESFRDIARALTALRLLPAAS